MQTIVTQGTGFVQTFEAGLVNEGENVCLRILDFDKDDDNQLAKQVYCVLDTKEAEELVEILKDAINNCKLCKEKKGI